MDSSHQSESDQGAVSPKSNAPPIPIESPTKWNLSYRQYRFAQLVFQGGKLGPSYEQAGYNPTNANSRDSSASSLLRSPKVQRYLHHLAAVSARTSRAATLSRARKREILCDIAEDSEDGYRLKAIEIDNKMTGDEAPVRLEGEITLRGILERLQPSLGLPESREAAREDLPANQLSSSPHG